MYHLQRSYCEDDRNDTRHNACEMPAMEILDREGKQEENAGYAGAALATHGSKH